MRSCRGARPSGGGHDGASDLRADRGDLAGTVASSRTVMSRVVLTVVFFLVVTPVGLLRRLLGKDSLRVRAFKAGDESVMLTRNHVCSGADLDVRTSVPRHPSAISEGLVGLPQSAQEILAAAAILVLLGFGALTVLTSGTAIAPFIYSLFYAQMKMRRSWDLRLLPRQRRRAGRGRRSSPRRRRSDSPARATTRHFRSTPCRYVLDEAGVARGSRRGRVLREAIPQVRAPARDLPSFRASRPRQFRHGHAHLAQGKAIHAATARRAAAAARRSAPSIYYPEHHLSHAASAFYPSPFDDAAILTIDGVGEWATATIGRGRAAESNS